MSVSGDTIACFLRPVDVLYLRGNKLFGTAGDHGEALMPPWPSMAAGALRSQLLAAGGVPLHDYALGTAGVLSDALHALGTPENPGAFRIAWFSAALLAIGEPRPVLPIPADHFVQDPGKEKERPEHIVALTPVRLPDDVVCSAATPDAALLQNKEQAKPASGWLLNAEGIAAWVRGAALDAEAHLVAAPDVWRTETRLGIARNLATGTAAEGQIYTSDVVSFCGNGDATDGGFLVMMKGLAPEAAQEYLVSALLRLGGDGRAATVETLTWAPPEPDWERIEKARACRIMLTTPGIFPDGWRLPGMKDDGTWHGPNGLTGRVHCAAVPRHQVVSGWDLAALTDPRRTAGERKIIGTGHPKPAQKAAPVGSVYWLNELDGDIRGGLSALLREGLWACMDKELDVWSAQRRAEGFNNCLVGAPITD